MDLVLRLKVRCLAFYLQAPRVAGKNTWLANYLLFCFLVLTAFYYFNCTSISSETVIEALNKGMFCTLYFDNFDPTDDTYKKYFENMISEGYVLDKVGRRVWCKHCNVILSSVSDEGSNAAIGFGDKDGAPDKKEAPFVDKIIRLKKVNTDTIKEVAVKRSIKVLENISSKFSNVKVDFSHDILSAAILDFLGEDLTLDTLDSEISEFLSEKLCDSLVELSSSGGILHIDKLLTKVSK